MRLEPRTEPTRSIWVIAPLAAVATSFVVAAFLTLIGGASPLSVFAYELTSWTQFVVLKAIGLRSGDARWDDAARFWIRIFGINFAVGVVTGVPMEFQFGTNWAAFSRYAGGVIGQTLAMEGLFAFFLESGFLAVLVFGAGATMNRDDYVYLNGASYFLFGLALAVTPVAIVLFRFDLSAHPVAFALVMALGVIGFAVIGTLFAAAVSSTRLAGGLVAFVSDPGTGNDDTLTGGAGTDEIHPLVTEPIRWGDYPTQRGVISGPINGFFVNTVYSPPPTDPSSWLIRAKSV